MPDPHAAWKRAAQVFLFNRFLILCVTCACLFFLPALIPGYISNISADTTTYHILPSQNLNLLLFSWLHWDAKAYLNISALGYRRVSDVSFFPLWPLTQHIGGIVLGGSFPVSYYLAGLLLANLFFYIDLIVLYLLIVKRYGRAAASRTLFYFSFSPFALFFFAGYAESLFMLLVLGMFLCLQRGQPQDWWLAGLCGLLATLTRSAGLLLALPFLVVYLQRFRGSFSVRSYIWRQRLTAGIPVVLIPIGLLVYMAYLFFSKGNALLFLSEEGAIWHRQLTFPLLTLWLALQAFPHETPWIFQAENLANLIAVLIPFAILVRGWRSIPLHYTIFALSTALFALSFPTIIAPNEPLLSQPRYMMILFPCTLLLAQWGKDARFDIAFRCLSTLAFVLGIALFVSNVWVA